MPNIRPFQPPDLDALHTIARLTGDAGQDATGLHANPQFIHDIYVTPYVKLAPELVLVLEDDHGVGGYIMGAFDTAKWVTRVAHQPELPPVQMLADFPAHIHMNLLPRLQGLGFGAKLLSAWLTSAQAHGVKGVHVGVDRRNQSAIGFWRNQKFHLLEPDDDPETHWMGRYIP